MSNLIRKKQRKKRHASNVFRRIKSAEKILGPRQIPPEQEATWINAGDGNGWYLPMVLLSIATFAKLNNK